MLKSDFSIDQNETTLMQAFVCDNSWPICLYDLSYANKCPDFLCYRVGFDLTTLMNDDYFYSGKENVGLNQSSPVE